MFVEALPAIFRPAHPDSLILRRHNTIYRIYPPLYIHRVPRLPHLSTVPRKRITTLSEHFLAGCAHNSIPLSLPRPLRKPIIECLLGISEAAAGTMAGTLFLFLG